MTEVTVEQAQSQLKTVIERLQRLDEDMDAVKEDIKEVLAEAKGNGYDGKILRKIVRALKQDRAKREEEESVYELYMSAIGEV